MILSFAKTEDEFLSGDKRVTRRRFSERHTRTWQNQWDKGNHEHDAYDKNPRAQGKNIGRFKLTCRPYLEKVKDMPHEDLLLEGGMVDSIEEFAALIGATLDEEVTVLRFEKIS